MLRNMLFFLCDIMKIKSICKYFVCLFAVFFLCEVIFRQLTKILNFDMNGLLYDSPHVKVSILLQMYLSDLELPNQEYIVDLKSVLDQSLRILQVRILFIFQRIVKVLNCPSNFYMIIIISCISFLGITGNFFPTKLLILFDCFNVVKVEIYKPCLTEMICQ